MVAAEFYILMEIVTFYIFLKGLERKELVYPFLSMGLFFGLSIAAFDIQSLFNGFSDTAWLGVWINFGMGWLEFTFGIIMVMQTLRQVEDIPETEV